MGSLKKNGVAQLKKKADSAFSQYVRYRDGWYNPTLGIWECECITCSVVKPLKETQAGHFVSRGKNILRYDELNVNAQCIGCNMFKAGEQYLYSKALDLKYGEGTAESLMQQRFTTHKLTIPELEQIIEDSKAYVKEALANPDRFVLVATD